MIQKTAKEIFWEYSCNHFFLDREGMMEEYVKLGGNKPSDERKWRREYIDYWYTQIPNDEIKAFRSLVYAEAKEILRQLVKFNSFRDDYIKFWYAFELLEISKFSLNLILKIKAKRRAKGIFNELSNRNILLLDENRNQIDNQMMEVMKAETPEDYIKNYSQRKLLKFK
jgi:hypothetical protein